MKFKYGQQVKVISPEFFSGSLGIIIDYSDLLTYKGTKFKYTVKLSHTMKIFDETQLELCNPTVFIAPESGVLVQRFT